MIPNITILGVTLDTTALGLKFKNQSGLEISQTQFFALAGLNTLVKAKGTITSNGSVISWNEIKVER